MKAPLVGAGLLVLIPSAHALINFNTSEIDLTNTAGITYDSNVSGGPKGKDDTILNYSPRLDFARKAGLVQLTSNLGVNFTHYFDQTNLDAQDVSAGVQLNLAEAIRGAFTGSAQASYSETEAVVQDINTRIHSDTLSFGASGQVQLDRRMSLSAGTNFSNSRRSGGTDADSLGANLGWTLSDFLRGTALHVDYAYSYSHSDASPFAPISLNQTSNQITAGLSRLLFPNGTTTVAANVGYNWLDRSAAEKAAGLTTNGGYVFNFSITGPFLPRDMFPKLHSSFNVSYSQSVAPGLNDNDDRALQGSVSLDWQARERTSVGLSVSQNRTLTISNLTGIPTTVEIHASQTLLHNLSAMVGASYVWTTYRAPRIAVAPTSSAAAFYASSFAGSSRQDETLAFHAGLNYTFAQVWSSGLRYDYTKITSSSPFGAYDHHVVNFNVSCRY
jgi:hypothetical protein